MENKEAISGIGQIPSGLIEYTTYRLINEGFTQWDIDNTYSYCLHHEADLLEANPALYHAIQNAIANYYQTCNGFDGTISAGDLFVKINL